MIRDFLSWWAAQLIDLAPNWLARPDPSALGAVLVEPSAGRAGVRLLHRRGAEERLIGSFALDDPAGAEAFRDALAARPGDGSAGTVLIRLPAGAALQRDVTLPVAAEAGLDRLLGYEMDRLTPFAADEIFYSWSVLRRDRENNRLSLRLSMVLRRDLLPLLDILRETTMPAQAIEVAPGAGNARGLRIPLAHDRTATVLRARRLLGLAWGGCAVLAVLAVALPFALQSLALMRVDNRIDALRPPVATVQALQRRVSGGAAGAGLVTAERRRLGDTLGVLAALTRVMPDDSYLTDLTLRQGQLTFSGQSAAAARLIPAISADPAFQAPTFAAPVTRIEGQNADLFSIRAGVSP